MTTLRKTLECRSGTVEETGSAWKRALEVELLLGVNP